MRSWRGMCLVLSLPNWSVSPGLLGRRPSSIGLWSPLLLHTSFLVHFIMPTPPHSVASLLISLTEWSWLEEALFISAPSILSTLRLSPLVCSLWLQGTYRCLLVYGNHCPDVLGPRSFGLIENLTVLISPLFSLFTEAHKQARKSLSLSLVLSFFFLLPFSFRNSQKKLFCISCLSSVLSQILSTLALFPSHYCPGCQLSSGPSSSNSFAVLLSLWVHFLCLAPRELSSDFSDHSVSNSLIGSLCSRSPLNTEKVECLRACFSVLFLIFSHS